MTSEFHTLSNPTEAFLHKEKKSKFWGYAIPLYKEADLKVFIEKLQSDHPNANHFCYAWSMGIHPEISRKNDDGEPNNTAAAPIYGQIQSFNLCYTAVVVVREFGGVKLGSGGLISAYKTAAQGALEQAKIVKKKIKKSYKLSVTYPKLHKLMRLIKQQHAVVLDQKLGNLCEILIEIPLDISAEFEKTIRDHRDIKLNVSE